MVTAPVAAYRDGSEEHPATMAPDRSTAAIAMRALFIM
jgi:hypothetical protein